MKPYNGHRSWAAWNVSLWLNNDEGFYNAALFSIQRAKEMQLLAIGSFARSKSIPERAAIILKNLLPERTPDGARFTFTNLGLALQHFDE